MFNFSKTYNIEKTTRPAGLPHPNMAKVISPIKRVSENAVMDISPYITIQYYQRRKSTHVPTLSAIKFGIIRPNIFAAFKMATE